MRLRAKCVQEVGDWLRSGYGADLVQPMPDLSNDTKASISSSQPLQPPLPKTHDLHPTEPQPKRNPPIRCCSRLRIFSSSAATSSSAGPSGGGMRRWRASWSTTW